MRVLIFIVLLAGCASQPLPLAERFERVAFDTEKRGFFDDQLWRWEWPIRVRVIGSQEYNGLVSAQVAQLAALTDQPHEMHSDYPTMTIEFSTRNREWFCLVTINGSPVAYSAEIYIATDQHPRHIRRCIAQELSQAMGLIADTDGRRDTAFSSAIGTDYLTEADLALFEILYDRRLRAGMHRDEVMPIVRQIVAEMEQEAGR